MNEQQLSELAAKTESDVADIKIIFPSYGSGFIEACLLVSTTHTHTHTHINTHTHTRTHTHIHTHTHMYIHTHALKYLCTM